MVQEGLQRPRVVVAPTAFKGTLTPREAADLIARIVREVFPRARIRKVPVADGGDGTLEVLARRIRTMKVRGPLGRPVVARYGRGVVEMAEASGLRRLRRLDPIRATTYGTGQLIAAAGPGPVLIGIGGSATVDGGVGALEALGARFFYRRDELVGLDLRGVRAPPMEVLCDVRTRLTDCARVFGPQKGATPAQVRILQRRLARLRHVVRVQLGVDLDAIEGGGAAGGLGAGLALIGARLVPGARRVLDEVGFHTRGADLVITGEGRVDETTLAGKAAGAVIEASRAPVGIYCGSSTISARRLGVRWIACDPESLKSCLRAGR
jgi:glycerate kinase